jgi:hypothetical protein
MRCFDRLIRSSRRSPIWLAALFPMTFGPGLGGIDLVVLGKIWGFAMVVWGAAAVLVVVAAILRHAMEEDSPDRLARLHTQIRQVFGDGPARANRAGKTASPVRAGARPKLTPAPAAGASVTAGS